MRRTQAERREQTRGALLAAARELFAEQGIADTRREEIAERAGVSHGALYHHFASKGAVAAAVIEELNVELTSVVIAASEKATDTHDVLRRCARAYVEAAAAPDVARLLLEAPLVLSPERMREINAEVSAQLLEPWLVRLGVTSDPAITARLMLGMLDEAATVVAASPRSKRRVIDTLDELFTKLVT